MKSCPPWELVALTACTMPLSVRIACVTPAADHEFVARASLHSAAKVTPPVSADLLRV